jgi:L-ascorbate metabolism protein UlaG (beta-lactamase superfamily)
MLRSRVLHLRRFAPAAADDLQVDVVLISHVHWDHLDVPSLDLLGRDVLVVVPRGAGLLLPRRRFPNVAEVAAGETMTIDGAKVRATEAAHRVGAWERRAAPPAIGFVVEGAQSVYFAGDTDLFDGMASLAPHLDVALLPVAGWGPRLPAGHLDPSGAARALRLLRPEVAIPIHWGTYGPIWRRKGTSTAAPPNEFRRFAATIAPAVDVRVLQVGETTEVP